MDVPVHVSFMIGQFCVCVGRMNKHRYILYQKKKTQKPSAFLRCSLYKNGHSTTNYGILCGSIEVNVSPKSISQMSLLGFSP